MPLVAIAREMGAGGTEVSAKLACALNIPLVHKEIADRVVQHWAIPGSTILDIGAAMPPPYKGIGSLAERYVACIVAEVLSVAASCNAVFRGWGAAQLLRGVGHAVRVRIGAPIDVRVERVARRTGLDMRLAKRMILKNDAIRAQLIRTHTGCDWRDPDVYDMEINTGRLTVDDAVNEILALVSSPTYEETEKSRQGLANMQLEALARATLQSHAATRDLRLHLRAAQGELELGGIVRSGEQRELVIRLLSAMSAPARITSRLRAPTDFKTRASSI